MFKTVQAVRKMPFSKSTQSELGREGAMGEGLGVSVCKQHMRFTGITESQHYRITVSHG